MRKIVVEGTIVLNVDVEHFSGGLNDFKEGLAEVDGAVLSIVDQETGEVIAETQDILEEVKSLLRELYKEKA